MATTSPTTAIEILDEFIQPIEPSFAPEFAQLLLRLRLSNAAQARVRELLQRNNAGELEENEKALLENYLLVGQFVDLLQAKARVSLKDGASSP